MYIRAEYEMRMEHKRHIALEPHYRCEQREVQTHHQLYLCDYIAVMEVMFSRLPTDADKWDDPFFVGWVARS